ncbi:MAG: helix-turn-helix transcriptional regulator [Myxococcales bacterium]|nr:helix-turn-helix transcriptional regulator [Myxococcales bacterium]
MAPNEIRALLVLRGVRITDIAQQCNASRQHVGQVVSGMRATPRIREAIAFALGTTVDALFTTVRQPLSKLEKLVACGR